MGVYKKCFASTSYVTRELQIKTTVRCSYTNIRTVEVQSTNCAERWWGCGATGTVIHHWWECTMAAPLWKTVWQFLTKQNTLLPYSAAVTFRGAHSNELKMCPHKSLQVSVYSSFNHDGQNLEVSKMFLNRWMNK